VATARALPLLEAGDHVALLDTGAYYFSNHFAYQLAAPPRRLGLPRTTRRQRRLRPGPRGPDQDELLAESGAALPPLHRGL